MPLILFRSGQPKIRETLSALQRSRAVLDLVDRVVTAQVDSLAVFGRELRSHDEGPVVELFLNLLRVEAVGGGLQLVGVPTAQKGVVVLAIAHAETLEFSCDEVMTVEVVGSVERQEGGHAHHQRSECFVKDVEVVVREAATLPPQDTVVGIAGGIARRRRAKAAAHFHAFEDEVDAEAFLSLYAPQGGTGVIFLAGPVS